MSNTTKHVGRPIGSGIGKYTVNPNQKRKPGPGRPKLSLTPEEIEERKVTQRKACLAVYRRKRAEELERRKKNQERAEKVNHIIERIKQKLEKQEELIDDILNDIHSSDDDDEQQKKITLKICNKLLN